MKKYIKVVPLSPQVREEREKKAKDCRAGKEKGRQAELRSEDPHLEALHNQGHDMRSDVIRLYRPVQLSLNRKHLAYEPSQRTQKTTTAVGIGPSSPAITVSSAVDAKR